MQPPNSMEDLASRTLANHRVEGFGLETTMVYPCAFCAAPDWASHRILEMEEVMAKPHECSSCGRSARMIFQRDAGGVSFEIVQCGGPEQPDWFEPKMRRES